MNLKAVAFCALVMVASPAAAEPWGYYGGYAPAVPLYAVHAALHANGLRAVMQPVYSPPYIVVRAVSPDGQLVRVLLNARWGNIVAVMPLPPAAIAAAHAPSEAYPPPRPAEAYPRYGDARPDLKVEPPLPPPMGPMGPNGAVAPSASPSAQEHRPPAVARTPMPRPRPVIEEATATAAVKGAPALADAPAATAAAPPPAPATPAGAATSGDKPFPPAATLE